MASWEFATSEPITATIRIASGNISVAATAIEMTCVTITPARSRDDEARVLSDIAVDYQRGHLVIDMPRRLMLGRGGSVDVTVGLPEGSSCEISTASADIHCTGELAALTAGTASGDLTAARITGPAEVKTAAGDITIERAEAVQANTASGDVWLSRADGDVTVKTASGDVRVDAALGDHVEARTVSGDVRIAVTPGRDVYLDISTISGEVTSGLEPSDGPADTAMTVQCRTVSGDVAIERAADPAAT